MSRMARSTGSEWTSRQRAGGMAVGLFVVAARFGVAAADRALPQRFDLRKELVAGLLAQHLAQQHAERAHVAAQRRLFQVAGLRFKLGQPLRPALGIPQKSHRLLIMHDADKELIRGCEHFRPAVPMAHNG